MLGGQGSLYNRFGLITTTQNVPETVIAARLRHLGLLVLPWILLAMLWHGLSASGLFAPGLMPTPAQVGTKLAELLFTDRLAIDILRSTQRVTLGVALGILLAVPVGFLIGWYRSARTFLDPLINFFRALPPIALIPLVVVYFGIDEPAKVIILFYASFFSGVIVMYEGVAQISPLYIKVARTLGANEREIFFRVIVPLTTPHILTALRVALGVAWATLVASELVAAQQGLGALIQSAGSFFQIDVIYVGIVCIGTVALTMDLALRALTRRLIRWQERVDAH
jgi:NitT/TauT family transport system permease protein